MKRFLVLWAAACAAAGGLFAAAVSPDEAKAVANVWAAENAAFGAGGSAKGVFAVCDTNAAKTVLWYQVSMSGGGVLMVAPVTEIEPVIAALEDDPGELPAAHPLRGILTGDLRRRLRFLGLYAEDGAMVARGTTGASTTTVTRGSGIATPVTNAADKVAAAWGQQQSSKWARLLTKAASRGNDQQGTADIATQIGIVDGFEKGGKFTHWNQGAAGGGYCYNYYTPNHAVCGCVATAYAAMLQFYAVAGAPDEPYDNDAGCSYNGKRLSKCTDITGGNTEAKTMLTEEGTGAYDWSILDELKTRADYNTLTEEQRQFLGRVAFDAGVCVGMGWTDGESGAAESNIASSMTKIYGFKQARFISSPKQDQWPKLIYHQLWCNQPVGISIFSDSGEGHSVVAVGYGKDADGVDRVRIFAGWGGAGDAWYALPYINTASVLGGAALDFDTIQGIVTMIGYADDNVVPVVGQVIPGMDADLTCGGVTGKANTLGYFGLRLPPTATSADLELACQAKTFSVTVGAITDKATGAELCAAIPDAVTVLLLDSEAATTAAEAKAKALASGKPMLFFSGSSGEAASDAAWQIINDLDEGNIDGFTNKFVIAYFAWDATGTSSSDGKPSYGVFDPTVYTVANKWAEFNGRLAYDGYSTFTTNITADATNYVATAATKAAVLKVINDGYRAYQCRHSGITLEIASEPATVAATETFADAFTNGEEVVYTAPTAVTNAEAGVIYACAGWSVSAVIDGVTNAVAAGSDGLAKFTVTNDTAYLLTLAWKIAAVEVSCTVRATDGVTRGLVTTVGGAETNTQMSVWVPVPETGAADNTVRFVAIPEAKYVVGKWVEEGVVDGTTNTIAVTSAADAAIAVEVAFVASGRSLLKVAECPTMTSGTFAQTFTPHSAYDKEIGINGTGGYLDHGEVFAAVTPSEKVIDGITWACGSWALTNATAVLDEGEGATAHFGFDGPATLVWRWGIDVEKTLAAQGWSGATPAAQTISLGALPTGVSAEDVTFLAAPTGWDLTPTYDASGKLSLRVAANSDWAADNFGVTVTPQTLPEDMATNMPAGVTYALASATTEGVTNLTFTAPAAYTNEATGWIWAPEAWEATGDVTASGSGTTATVTVEEGNEVTLTWTWKKIGLRLSAQFAYPDVVPAFHEKSAMDAYEVWCLFGESATFTITNVWHGTSMPEGLQYWQCEGSSQWLPNGLSATVTAVEADGPVTLTAVMGAGSYGKSGTVTVLGETTNGVECVYGTSTLAYSNSLAAVTGNAWREPCAISLTVTTQLVDGVVWSCVGWELRSVADGSVLGSGTGTSAQFVRPEANANLVWLWAPETVPSPTPVYAQPTPIAFTTIAPTNAGFSITFTNAVKYCVYKLYSAATPTGFDLTADPDQSLTAEADGPASFEVPATATGLFWKVVAEPGLIP